MARNIVKAKLDIIFKKLFTDEGNQHLLQAYLSDTLGIPYDSIESLVVLNSEIMPDSITEKLKTRAITRIVRSTTCLSCTAVSLKAERCTAR